MAGWALTTVTRIPFLQDAFYYEELGDLIAQDWLAGRSSEWLAYAMTETREPWLLPFTIACFYWFSGGVRVIPVLLLVVCLITAWTPVIIYRIGRQLDLSPGGAMFAARLVAFSPAFAFWSGALYKEGLILLLLSIALLQIFRLQTQWRWDAIVIACVCLAGLFGLRFYIAALMFGVLSLGLLIGRGKGRDRSFLLIACRQLLIIAGFSVLLLSLGLTRRARAVLPHDLGEALETISLARSDLARSGASGFKQDISVAEPAEAIAFLPIGLSYFLFSPAPWQFGQLRQNLAIPETAFWTCLYPLAFWGIRRGLKVNLQGTILLLIAAAATSVLYALFAGNIGSIYRLRLQVWLIVAIFAGWGWEALQERRRAAQSIKVLRQRA